MRSFGICVYLYFEVVIYTVSRTHLFLALNKLFRVLERVVFSLFLRHSQIHASFSII